MSAHTPAPWTMVGREIFGNAFDGSARLICDRVRGGSPTAADANARLIAAAPDLLAALKRAVDTIRAFHGLGLPSHAEVEMWNLYQQSPEMQAINDAIAKAEGRR